MLRAHSHSESQFLPHLPPHWKSIMCPPHCGQTRLMIEEIMLAFGSPGVASIRLIVPPSRLQDSFPESSPACENARRNQGPRRATVNSLRVSVALKRSVLVGYGVRVGRRYCLTPRSLHDHANAMPIPNPGMLSSRASEWQIIGKVLAIDGLSSSVAAAHASAACRLSLAA